MPARVVLPFAAIVALCAAAAPSPKPSPAPPPAAAPSAPAASLDTGFYTIETDGFTMKGNGDFTMPNKVTFTRPGSDGTADHAEGNRERGTVTLIGNVVIHDNGGAPEAGDAEYAKGGSSTLTCDKLDVDSKAKIYIAYGNVRFDQGTRKMSADHAVLNRSTGMLHLDGHVKTAEGDSTMTADNADYNLTSKKFEAEGRPVTILQPVPSPEPRSSSPKPKPKKRRLPF